MGLLNQHTSPKGPTKSVVTDVLDPPELLTSGIILASTSFKRCSFSATRQIGIGADWLTHISKHTIVGRSSLNPFLFGFTHVHSGSSSPIEKVLLVDINLNVNVIEIDDRPVSPCPTKIALLYSCCQRLLHQQQFQASAVLRWRQSSAKSLESNRCWIQGWTLGSTSGRDGELIDWLACDVYILNR
jgi:hypothetical protein